MKQLEPHVEAQGLTLLCFIFICLFMIDKLKGYNSVKHYCALSKYGLVFSSWRAMGWFGNRDVRRKQ